MHRRLSAFLILLFSLVTVALAVPQRPNIVWVVSEDNSIHYLRLYDEGGIEMPTVERLAKNGLVFNHAFSNAPVCSAARSTIISGCYGPRTFAQFHRRSVKVPIPDGLHMFPWYLRQAGYYTTNNSKEDYNYIKGEDVWDESSNKASYRNREPGQPFFHVQNFGTTHEGKLHFSEEEMRNQKTKTDPDTVEVFPVHPDTPLFRYTNAKYRDLHQQVDAEIGKFLKQLEADGLMDDTFIFYYGDHGGVLPGSKGYIYERGLHVPMVVYVPENWRHLVPADRGSRIDGFVQFVDLGPTVLNLAGLTSPSLMDGDPFLGEGITLEALNMRDTAFGYADRFDEKYDFVRSLRKGKYKYMRNYLPFNVDGLQNNYRYRMLAYEQWRDLYKAGELTPQQAQFFEPRPVEALYDVEKDPFEMNNLANLVQYREILLSMRVAMREQVVTMPDLSFIPEPVLYREAAGNPVAYGQLNKLRIRRLNNIAEQSLRPFDQAEPQVAWALGVQDPLVRYWALISCINFGKEAKVFEPIARSMAAADPNNLVRMRAAEFLALTWGEDPRPVMIECLKQAQDHEEAAFILNTITLMHDGGFPFELERSWLPDEWFANKQSNVSRRYDYIQGRL